MEVKRVYLKTEHGYTFNVKLYNADTYTYFECKTWQALCKAYAFEPDMVITFDIRLEDDIEGNRDIWVDVQTPPVLPLSYFQSSKHVRRLVDRTVHCPGAELNLRRQVIIFHGLRILMLSRQISFLHLEMLVLKTCDQ